MPTSSEPRHIAPTPAASPTISSPNTTRPTSAAAPSACPPSDPSHPHPPSPDIDGPLARLSRLIARERADVVTPRARARRVVALIAAIALMCLGDLVMTIEHARLIGIFEANPVAREIMRAHPPEALVAFKSGSILLGCSLLFVLRRTRVAELGSLAALGVMTALCLHWSGYADGLEELTPQVSAIASGTFQCDTWVYWGP